MRARPLHPGNPLRLREWLHPLLFLTLFGGVLAFFLVTGRLSLARPGALWALGLVFALWWIHRNGVSGLRPFRASLTLWMRMLLTSLAVLLLAEPLSVRSSNTLNVMYALDMSDSITPEARDLAIRYILDSTRGKRPEDRVGLSVFARDAAVEYPPNEAFPFEAVNSGLRKDGTDIAQGLSLTAAMLPDTDPGRIVLLSDGAATGGRLEESLNLLRARQIPVDVLPIRYAYTDEVWLERLSLPRQVRVGEAYEATVMVHSLRAGRGTLVLEENGTVIFEQEISYGAGRTPVRLPIHIREPGYYAYRARIETTADSWERNNVAMGSLLLQGKGKVLLVVDPEADPRDTRYLQQALEQRKREVAVLSPFELPQTPEALAPFQAMVFVNVAADRLDRVQMQAVHDAVFHYGTGLCMLGGAHGFGPGGYKNTPIERALPVTMDIKQTRVLPKGALAIILHTCEFPEGNTWAKRITMDAIRVLHRDDLAGVIAYVWGGANGGDQWVVPLGPVSDFQHMVPLINSAQIGDMPSFDPGMQLALKGLQECDASSRHMIIISDGDPSPPSPGLLEEFQTLGVTVSTVSVFPHGGSATPTMQAIANLTGGRHYFPAAADELPHIFMKEAKTLQRKLVRNETFVPHGGLPSPVLKGIEALPPLHGYVLTQAKPGAQVLLEHQPEGVDEPDPILAIHRYGLGSAAAFTSDLGANWGRDWVKWERFDALVHQLVQEISRGEDSGSLTLRVQSDSGEGWVELTDHHPRPGHLHLQAQVRTPDDSLHTLLFNPTGPGRYSARFPLEAQGRYQVFVSARGKDREETCVAGYVLPYSREYLRFRADPLTLQQIADESGGRLLSGDAAADLLFDVERRPRRSTRPLFDWFFIALACLLPLDVALRRVHLDLRTWFRWHRPKKAASTTTMSQLLKTKQTSVTAPPRPRPTPGSRPAVRTPIPRAEPPPPPPPPTASPAGTAGKLLAAKRQRQQASEQENEHGPRND